MVDKKPNTPAETQPHPQVEEERAHQGSAWMTVDQPDAEEPLVGLPSAFLGTPPAADDPPTQDAGVVDTESNE